MQLAVTPRAPAMPGWPRSGSNAGMRMNQPKLTAPSRPRHRLEVVAAAAATVLKPGTIALVPVNRRLQREQDTILEAIKGTKGRGKSGLSPEQMAAFEQAVAVLEGAGGVPAPAASPLLEGRWKLLFTTRPGTASPIQRTFTGVESFSVYQDIQWQCDAPSRVDNVVDFGPQLGFLRVEAEASTERRPLPGFTPRRGEGLPFGILGRSSNEPPAKPDMRVDFRFDRAAFTFRLLPFKIPYPVPFKLLGDEAKGWIDITYLSPDGKFRLARGNKGTLFVLAKDIPPKDRLLEALAKGANDATIEALADELQQAASSSSGGGSNGSTAAAVAAPAQSRLALGKWRQLWTRQGSTANSLQQSLSKATRNWQIITEDGQLENRVALPIGVRVRAIAACEAESPTRTSVQISRLVVQLGPWELPLPVKFDQRGYLDWLYLDEDFRVTKGNRGSIFIHCREPAGDE